jgi:hypothetical protein
MVNFVQWLDARLPRWLSGAISEFFKEKDKKDEKNAFEEMWDFLDPMKLEGRMRSLPDTKARNPSKSSKGFE